MCVHAFIGCTWTILCKNIMVVVVVVGGEGGGDVFGFKEKPIVIDL